MLRLSFDNLLFLPLLSGALLLSSGPSSLCAAPLNSTQLVTGKRLSPLGRQTDVGSFPANAVLSPDGRFAIISDAGARESLSVLRASDGSLVSRLDWNGPSPTFPGKKRALYFGLVCGQTRNGETPVYASRGAEGTVSVLSLGSDGTLRDTGRVLREFVGNATAPPFIAGLALSDDGTRLFAANNSANPQDGMRGSLLVFNTQTGALERQIALPEYPFAVALAKSGRVYVTSEARGVVCVVDVANGKLLKTIATGAQPTGLLLDRSQNRLFVSNAGSDTLSVIDTRTNRVAQTTLLRPDTARGLPGATPLGLCLSPDESRLYVALADMNAVAVVDARAGRLEGFLPCGWYPTTPLVSRDGKRLLVANAKGVKVRNPNNRPVPGIQSRPQYIQNIIEGTVSAIDLAQTKNLSSLSARVIANNRGLASKDKAFVNPGIKHVFYIIKENRTYDQVLGDLRSGNGDSSLTLFGREVTPNLHALAERFALLDNFYCCAEVSGDGWNWSTGGMASEYVSRNVPHNYGGRVRPYDFEGTNNGVAVDRFGAPDVARPPGGYLWDLCASHKVSLRNYGFFTDDLKIPRTLPEEGTTGLDNSPTKRALIGHSDADFRQFDLRYPDSDAKRVLGLSPAFGERATYGSHADPSRVSAWKREFQGFIRNGNLPALSMIRLGRDHTVGTVPGLPSPRAMVADNDYAVGQVVEAISHSPYWKSSAIIIVEDDAQNGYDHVDAHRSTAYVISPFVETGTHYSRFGNTDGALKTIEAILGLPPMTMYDAIAAPLDVFGRIPSNAAPFQAILPSRKIISQLNSLRSFKAKESATLFSPLREESAPDEALNEILWRSIKGTTPPMRHYSLSFQTEKDDDD